MSIQRKKTKRGLATPAPVGRTRNAIPDPVAFLTQNGKTLFRSGYIKQKVERSR